MKKQRAFIYAVLYFFVVSLINAQTAPTLVSPVNGATDVYTNQTFSWSSVPNAVYRIQISTGSGFWWNQVDIGNLTATTYQASGLYAYTTYYWRVSATTETGTNFSTVWQFTTGQSTQSTGGPTLVFPANNAADIQSTNTFQWNSYTGASSYRLQISSSSSFTMNQTDADNISTTSYQVTNLSYSTTYYWRVGANTPNGIQYSDAWQFTTGLPGGSNGNPGPTLISPANTASNVSTNNTFTWNAIEGATYRIQIATSDYFGNNQFDVSGLTSPSYTANGLYILTPYYWRVNATTASGTSDWSTTWSFTTGTSSQSQIPDVPALASPANGSTNISLNTAITWNASQNASSYGLQVATDNLFSNLIVNTTGLTNLSYNLANLSGAVTYYWRVNGSNSSGTSSWSSVWNFTTKEAVPVLTVTQPTDSLLTNQPVISAIGSVANPSNIVKLNGNVVTVNADGSFSGNVNLTEGTNTIRITAYNNAGDSVVVIRSVTLDTILPVVTLSSPADSLITNQLQVTVSGNVNDTKSVVTINNDTVAVDINGNFTGNVQLSEGLNNIIVKAKDRAGNSVSLARVVRLDSIIPALTLTAPADSLITNVPLLNINGNVVDSTAVLLTINQDTVQISLNGNFTKQITLAEGKNSISVLAVDKAGNSALLTRTVILDTKLPVVTITFPANNFSTDSSSVHIVGTVSDSSNVTLTINNQPVTVASNGGFNYELQLTAGNNEVVINSTDEAGNTITINRTVIYQPIIIPPDPALTAPPINDSYAKTFYDANSFLWAGTNAIQYEVTPGSIEEHRVGVVRGAVIKTNGEPLPGVKVYSPNHPEWGYTFTRVDGKYDFGLNAGGYLSVNFERNGYRPANRIFDSPWNRFVVLDTVALAQIDPPFTVVNFTDPFTVAQSSINTDIDGSRRATIFFEQGTITTITLPDNSTQQMDSITARATEYTVEEYGPKAMPANLPPSVSYTYCTELTADEALAVKAKNVLFDKPVRLFTENFIGFPVGTAIPTGIWDWVSSAWLPHENGIVLKIIGITGGLADISIDPNGTIADSTTLYSLGITNSEREYIASVFNIGQAIWRTRLNQFGIIDQGFGSIQPDNVTNPKIDRIESFVNEEKYSGLSPVSEYDVLNQTVHKEISITGTPLSLTYSSDRVEGRKSQLVIPITGTAVEPSLRKVLLEITILGVKTEKEFTAAPNQSYTFIWDGKDSFGRTVPGRHKADIRLGFVHASNYQQPALSVSSFGSLSGISIPDVYSREYITLWQCTQAVLGEVNNRAAAFGGWNLNMQHGYDPVTNTIYLGSGQKQISESLGYILETVAGNGNYGASGNNVTAVNSRLAFPTNLAVAPDGSVYFIEYDTYKIKKVDPNGIITTVAGNGTNTTSGDGGPASQASLHEPTDLAVDKNGNIYFLQSLYQSRLRKIDVNGIITTVAGGSGVGYSGDGGPAADAKLWRPYAIEIDPEGNIYIADQNCEWSIPSTPCYSNSVVIRKIDTDGIITTIAGGGSTYYSNPQTVPATQVMLDNITGLKIGPDGDLYIVCSQRSQPNNPLRHIILKLSSDGKLRKVTAGGFTDVYDDDGKTASQAQFPYPYSLTFDQSCSSCFTTYLFENRILTITPDYIVNTLAGKKTNQTSTDGTPAKKASLNFPYGIDTGPDGNIYFVEREANKVRKLVKVQPAVNQSEYFVNSTTGKEIYVFNNSGKHVRTEDALTNKKLFTFGYDADGRLVTIRDVDSLVTTIERDTSGNATAIISPRGERTNLAVNIDGYLTSVSNPNNETIGLGYIRDGLLSQFTDPKNNASLFDYDSQGRLISKQTPGEGAVTYTKQKTSDGYTVTETKPLGEQVVHRIYNQLTRDVKREVTNAQGISINVKDLTTFVDTLFLPDGSKSITETGFDPRFGVEVPVASKTTTKTPGGLTNTQQQLREVTVWDGPAVKNMKEDVIVNSKTFRTEYTNKIDGINNYVKSISAEGRITEKFYDEKGRLIKEIIPGAGEVEYLYLQNKLTQKIHYPENPGTERTEFYFYDSKDRLISSTDPLWHADSMQYDNAGRLTRYVFKDGRAAHFNYDAKGNLTSIVPPGKTAHLFEFDSGDKKTAYKPPVVDFDSLNAIRYVYDQDGKLTKTVMPDNSEIQMIYDADNCNCTSSSRVKSIAYNGGTITYNYNTLGGQVTQVTTSSGDTLSYTYDGSLPKSEIWKGTVSGSVGLTYNNDFRVTEQKVNGGSAVAFAYDKDGLMTQAGNLKMKYSTATGQLLADTLGNITSSYQYSDFGELKNYTVRNSSSVLFSTNYVRDDLGRITQLTETKDTTTVVYNYIYDTAGRLVEVKKDGVVTANYIYDSNGNRLAKVVGSDSTKGVYDGQDRLLQYGNDKFVYNKNGYLIRKIVGIDTTKYTYDNLGNLLLVNLPNGSTLEYAVDANNRRIAKKVNGNVVKKWLYSGELTPIAELDSAGNITARFVYATKSNTPDYIVMGDTTYKIISDHLGSARLIINVATGEIKQQIKYDEFGNVLSQSGSIEIPFGYAGGIYDEQTKLVRFGARDYSATMGRWTAKDPILFDSDDLNMYGYTLNDPLNMIDPDGKDAFLAFDLLVNAVFALANWQPEVAIITASVAVGPILASTFGGGGKSSVEDWAKPASYETRVSRWMSEGEYQAMKSTGALQVGSGGRTYVTALGAPKGGNWGNVRVDFNVPTKSLAPAGNKNWFQILSINRVPVTGITRIQ